VADGCKTLFLRVFGCGVEVDCRDAEAFELLAANYGQMQSVKSGPLELKYTIARPAKSFSIAVSQQQPLLAKDAGEFLFLFEKDLTIRLQKLRRDLYFLHAGALGFCGQAFLLVAASGQGKSTTAWALLHHGFQYLSDELAAFELDSLKVQPYPHAICLKQNPPAPYFLPDQAVRASSTLHIPISLLPDSSAAEPMPVMAIFFLDYSPGRKVPSIRDLSSGESAARLFVHALNPLAHAEDGLAGAARIAQSIRSFHLTSGQLARTCELIANTLEITSTRHGLRVS
jgi:hypothetical protein